MKVSLLKSVVLTLGVIAMLTACKREKGNDVNVSLSASSTSFTNGQVELTVSLSGTSTTAVSATISAAGTVPAAALSFNSKVSIAAGETSAKVPVTVDLESLEAGNYEAVFTIASVSGAQLNSAKASVTVSLAAEGSHPVVSIKTYSDTFAEGKATFTIGLDKAAAADVVVNFEVKSEDGSVPADALTFSNPATVPAGATEFVVNVTLDDTKLATISSYAIIAISSVSENAEVATTKTKTWIQALGSAKLRNDWRVAFEGDYEQDGNVYHSISAQGVEGGYYIFVYEKGLVASNFKSLSEYLQYMEINAVGPAIGTDDAYQIKKGDTGWLYYKFAVGDYEVFLAGCTEDGHITGEYATCDFSVEPTPEMLAAYDQYLGEWVLQSPKMAWTISEKQKGVSYTIMGIEGQEWPVEALLNEDLQLEIHAQGPMSTNYEATYQGTTYTCSVYLYGIDNDPNSGYYWTGDYVIAYGELDNDGNIALSGGSVSSSDGEFEIGTMIYIAEDNAGKIALSISNNACGLPNMLLNPDNIEEEESPVVAATYDDFIGEWVIDGFWFGISSSDKENTYEFSIGDGYEAEAKFEDGTLTLYDQVFGSFTHQSYGACRYMIGGIFTYGGSEYMYYYNNNGKDFSAISKIFTAQLHESGNVTFIPGTCQYGDYVAFRYRWWIAEEGDNYGLGNWLTDSIYLDGIMKPYVEEAEPTAASIRRNNKVERGSVSRVRGRSAKSIANRINTL